jgi:hypothetical protein
LSQRRTFKSYESTSTRRVAGMLLDASLRGELTIGSETKHDDREDGLSPTERKHEVHHFERFCGGDEKAEGCESGMWVEISMILGLQCGGRWAMEISRTKTRGALRAIEEVRKEEGAQPTRKSKVEK